MNYVIHKIFMLRNSKKLRIIFKLIYIMLVKPQLKLHKNYINLFSIAMQELTAKR
jgi:hypothetical protein